MDSSFRQRIKIPHCDGQRASLSQGFDARRATKGEKPGDRSGVAEQVERPFEAEQQRSVAARD
jgi:hypothetical protein